MAERAAGSSDWLAGKRVGLSLSSGFFGFFAHLGLWQALRALGVEPVAMAGCSAGALVGSMAAAGMDVGAIRERLLAIRARDLLEPPRLADLRRGPPGLVRGERVERDIAAALPVQTFEECRIPLALTAFDIGDRVLRSIESGPLAPAVRASVSMPGIFCPAPVDGHALWDGGVVEKAPLSFLLGRDDLDVIVVGYLARRRPDGRPRTLLGGIRAALDSHIVAAGRRDVAAARERGVEVYVLAPDVPRCGPHLLGRGPEIIERAEAETLRIVREADFGCVELA